MSSPVAAAADPLAALVRGILDRPEAYEWAIDATGELMCMYLSWPFVRLHVWAKSRDNVSAPHDHSLPFESRIISGVMRNQRYQVEEGAPNYMCATTATGEDCHPARDPRPVRLVPLPIETYSAGERYAQRADEVHDSFPEAGTVTICTVDWSAPSAQYRVFWKIGAAWADTSFRRPSDEELRDVTERALGAPT